MHTLEFLGAQSTEVSKILGSSSNTLDKKNDFGGRDNDAFKRQLDKQVSRNTQTNDDVARPKNKQNGNLGNREELSKPEQSTAGASVSAHQDTASSVSENSESGDPDLDTQSEANSGAAEPLVAASETGFEQSHGINLHMHIDELGALAEPQYEYVSSTEIAPELAHPLSLAPTIEQIDLKLGPLASKPELFQAARFGDTAILAQVFNASGGGGTDTKVSGQNLLSSVGSAGSSVSLASPNQPSLAVQTLQLDSNAPALASSSQQFSDTLAKAKLGEINLDSAQSLFDRQNVAAAALTGATLVSSSSASTELSAGLAQPAPRFAVNIQFGQATWNNGVAAKVAQMAAQNLSFAEIQLDPPELGPLQVRVQINNDQASVAFSTHSAQVRDALEHGHTRLKEMFQSEGINLVDVDVGSDQQNKEDAETEQSANRGLAGSSSDEEQDMETEGGPGQTSSVELAAGVDDYV